MQFTKPWSGSPIQIKLKEYNIKAVTGGKDAGEVSVRVQANGHTFSGRGVSTDIIEASAGLT